MSGQQFTHYFDGEVEPDTRSPQQRLVDDMAAKRHAAQNGAAEYRHTADGRLFKWRDENKWHYLDSRGRIIRTGPVEAVPEPEAPRVHPLLAAIEKADAEKNWLWSIHLKQRMANEPNLTAEDLQREAEELAEEQRAAAEQRARHAGVLADAAAAEARHQQRVVNRGRETQARLQAMIEEGTILTALGAGGLPPVGN